MDGEIQMRVAVTQPTYLPWMGLFAMIDSVDTFVFLDDVQFEKQSWQQRNRIKGAAQPIWLTVPVYRQFGQKLSEARINYETDWQKKHWESIRQSYAMRYSSGEIQEWYTTHFDYLVDLNIHIIESLVGLLGINRPKFVRSSRLSIPGKKAEHLEGILQCLGATEYLANPGSRGYLEPCLPFKGIKVEWFDYKHPVYPQARGDFIPYMSVVDLLLNAGSDALKYIREGMND